MTTNADLIVATEHNAQVHDDAHHIYTYTVEVLDPVVQVDIRLDFGDS